MLEKETLQETEHRNIRQEGEGAVGGWSGLLLLLATAKCHSLCSLGPSDISKLHLTVREASFADLSIKAATGYEGVKYPIL